MIEDGNAKVTVHGEEKRRLGPGDYFGEIALIAQSARTASVTAESDLTAHGMTFWDFRPLVEGHASIAWKLLQAFAKTYGPDETLGQAPTQRDEILARLRGIAAELVDLDAVRQLDDAAAEERAAHAELRAEADDLARRLAHPRRPRPPSPRR